MKFTNKFLFLFLFFITSSFSQDSFLYSPGAYDRGPDPNTEVGRAWLEYFASHPNMEGLSKKLNGVRFRPIWGPIFYRGRTGFNEVKMGIWGQDGTHIAEIANRPFTGGTGGRLQGLAEYLGVNRSYHFTNTYVSTIAGQHADYAPVLIDGKLVWRQFMNPDTYLLSQSLISPIVDFRNRHFDMLIDANPDSLRVIATVGGAAKESLATYINSRGGYVPPAISDEDAARYQMVKYKKAYAGGNNYFFYPVDEKGRNALLKPGEAEPNYKSREVQNELMSRANDPDVLDRVAKLKGGPDGNGMFSRYQFGPDLSKMEIGGERTQSLKGLKYYSPIYKKTKIITHGIGFINFPHPGSIASAGGDKDKIAKKIKQLNDSFQREADRLLMYKNSDQYDWDFEIDKKADINETIWGGKQFDYKMKGKIPDADYAFGQTDATKINQSISKRVSGKPEAIVVGSRVDGYKNKEDIARVKGGWPSDDIPKNDWPWHPSREMPLIFDDGPPADYADLMRENLNFKKIFKVKPGMSVQKNGSDALYVKNTIDHGAFGYYRGTFAAPEIFILSDAPGDYDSIYSAVAMSGEEGQRLNGFLNGLGVEDKYLVLKTVPFDMTGASQDDWNHVLRETKVWREKLVNKIVNEQKPKLIIALGPQAQEQIKKLNIKDTPVIDLDIKNYKKAFDQVEKLGLFDNPKWIPEGKNSVLPKIKDIPRTHIPYGRPVWVGRSGDSVIREFGIKSVDEWGTWVKVNLTGTNYSAWVPDWANPRIDQGKYDLSKVPDLTDFEKAFIRVAKRSLREGGAVFTECNMSLHGGVMQFLEALGK
ncbi:MAG: hypothetical protein H6621_07965 [Halobacteriovoraceae bacterium]|nr:hypothetical protein [Halobacteriovoraceae bacterium]